MSFGCRFAQLHFLFFFSFSLLCFDDFYDFKVIFLLLGLKHLRILQLPEMSSRLVGLDHFSKCSPDESLALWPVWASYSQAKMEVYIHTQTHTNRQHYTYSEKWREGACRGKWLCVSLTTSTFPALFGFLKVSYWAIHLLTFCFVWGKYMSEINGVF